MKAPRPYLVLVDPEERLSLRLGASTLYYRRLSLGALAAIERSQTIVLPGERGQKPRVVLPPAALEDALAGHVLVGWQGVRDAQGREVPFTPDNARRLPAQVRRLLLARARRWRLPPEQGGQR
jgi:hypothetical protein